MWAQNAAHVCGRRLEHWKGQHAVGYLQAGHSHTGWSQLQSKYGQVCIKAGSCDWFLNNERNLRQLRKALKRGNWLSAEEVHTGAKQLEVMALGLVQTIGENSRPALHQHLCAASLEQPLQPSSRQSCSFCPAHPSSGGRRAMSTCL